MLTNNMETRLKAFLNNNDAIISVLNNHWHLEVKHDGKKYGVSTKDLTTGLECMEECVESIKAGNGMPPCKITAEVV